MFTILADINPDGLDIDLVLSLRISALGGVLWHKRLPRSVSRLKLNFMRIAMLYTDVVVVA